MANFRRQYADRHMNLWFMRCVNERERTIWQSVIVKNKLTSVFHTSVLLLTMNFVITCQSSLRIHSAIASWIHSYFDNAMTKFIMIIKNKTDAWKTDVNFLTWQCQDFRRRTDHIRRRPRISEDVPKFSKDSSNVSSPIVKICLRQK